MIKIKRVIKWCLFFLAFSSFFQPFCMKNVEMLTSVWSAQHPNTGQNIQRSLTLLRNKNNFECKTIVDRLIFCSEKSITIIIDTPTLFTYEMIIEKKHLICQFNGWKHSCPLSISHTHTQTHIHTQTHTHYWSPEE